MPPKRGGRKKAGSGRGGVQGRKVGREREMKGKRRTEERTELQGRRKDSESDDNTSAAGSDTDEKNKPAMLSVSNYDIPRLLEDPKFAQDNLIKRISPQG